MSNSEEEMQKALAEMQQRMQDFQSSGFTPVIGGKRRFWVYSSNLKLTFTVVGLIIVLAVLVAIFIDSKGHRIDTYKNYRPAAFLKSVKE